MMKNYLVRWEIEVDADTPTDAAQQAREIQLDKESTATIFEVVAPDTGGLTIVDTSL